MIRHIIRGGVAAPRLSTCSTQLLIGVLDAQTYCGSRQRRGLFSKGKQALEEKPNRFFYPSRPDFLPSKSTPMQYEPVVHEEADDEVPLPSDQYTPIGNAQVVLPPPDSISSHHSPLYTSLSEQKSPVDIWAHFTAHLSHLTAGQTTSIDSSLFDSLFWLLFRTDPEGVDQCGSCFKRVQVLMKYASEQGGYGLTRLQLHRAIHLWILCWNKCDKDVRHEISLGEDGFLEYVLPCLQELDSIVVSLLVKQMVENVLHTTEAWSEPNTTRLGAWSNKEIKRLHRMVKTWLHFTAERKGSRQESWVTSSTSPMHSGEEDAGMPMVTSRQLNDTTWIQMLSLCTAAKHRSARSLGIFCLEQDTDYPLPVLSRFFISHFTTVELLGLLPRPIQQGANGLGIGYTPPFVPAPFSSQLSDDRRRRLTYIIAHELARRKEYAVALYLHDADPDSRQEEELSAAAVCASASRAISNTCSKRALRLLRVSLRLYMEGRWYESVEKSECSKLLVDALWRFIKPKQQRGNADGQLNVSQEEELKEEAQERTPMQTKEHFHYFLRQFTTVFLTHEDVDDDTSRFTSQQYGKIIAMHIQFGDYPFAKRLFLVSNIQGAGAEKDDTLTTPFLDPLDFFWLFQAALSREDGVGFARQLFVHWTTFYESGNDNLGHLMPSSLLRMYSAKLMKEGHKAGILHLEKYSYAHKSAEAGRAVSTHRNQAIRMIRIAFRSSGKYIDSSLKIAENVIDEWKRVRHDDVKTLAHLYAITLSLATKIKRPDKLLQSKIMAIFYDFQTFFRLASKRLVVLDNYVWQVYAAALKMLIEKGDKEEMAKRAEEWWEEVTVGWKTRASKQLWDLRIEAHLFESLRAREIFSEALHSLRPMSSREAVAPTTVFRLVVALTNDGYFSEAQNVIGQYRRQAAPLSRTAVSLLETAELALLSIQGVRAKVDWRIESVNDASNGLHHASPEWGASTESDARSAEDWDLSETFGRLASGQRYKRKGE